MENLEDDLEWKLTYVGSAESSIHDQILDTIYVGPVPEGRHMFVFQADAPDHNKIPCKDFAGGHRGPDLLLLPRTGVHQGRLLCP